jgi:hypothetical protein
MGAEAAMLILPSKKGKPASLTRQKKQNLHSKVIGSLSSQNGDFLLISPGI